MPHLPFLYLALLLVVGVALVVLTFTRWIAFRPLNRLIAQQRSAPQARPTAPLPPLTYAVEPPLFSIVVPSINDAAWIERHLPLWLQQEQPHYEVIIADASDDEEATHHIVKRAQQNNPHLRYTRLPDSTRNLDLRLGALALAIRAARAPWVVLTQADCAPHSPQWLSALTQQCNPDTDVIIGQIDFDDLGSENLRTTYEHLRRFALNASCTLQGRACGGDARCIALRKTWWQECGGWCDALEMGYGECALLIDRHAQAERIALALSPTAAVRQDIPEGETLRRLRHEALRTRHRLRARHSWTFVRDSLASWAWSIAWLALGAFILLRMFHFFGNLCPLFPAWGVTPSTTPPYYTLSDLFYDAPALLLLLSLLTGAILATRQTMQYFIPDYRNGRTLYPILFDTLLPWRRVL